MNSIKHDFLSNIYMNDKSNLEFVLFIILTDGGLIKCYPKWSMHERYKIVWHVLIRATPTEYVCTAILKLVKNNLKETPTGKALQLLFITLEL